MAYKADACRHAQPQQLLEESSSIIGWMAALAFYYYSHFIYILLSIVGWIMAAFVGLESTRSCSTLYNIFILQGTVNMTYEFYLDSYGVVI